MSDSEHVIDMRRAAEPEPDGLTQWWIDTAKADLGKTLPKAADYGSIDLQMIGDALLRMIGWDDAPAGTDVEIGTLFYAYGKLARCLSAYSEKRLPNEDSLLDGSVYLMMARRARQTGSWP